jgi:hypothetical protein
MFKYVKFTKAEDEFTTHDFRGGSEEVKVNHFNVSVVSIEAEDAAILDEVIASQNERINCIEIDHAEFKELVGDSLQIKRIRKVVAERIASKYTYADEIAMLKRDDSTAKKIEYVDFVNESIAIGSELKSLIGY